MLCILVFCGMGTPWGPRVRAWGTWWTRWWGFVTSFDGNSGSFLGVRQGKTKETLSLSFILQTRGLSKQLMFSLQVLLPTISETNICTD